MSLLDTIPFTLFRALCSPTRTRNIAVLEQIFEQFFDDFAFAPKKAELLEVIRGVLCNPDYLSISDETDISSSSETAEYVVYNKLREDGWLMEVTNRKMVEIHMPREAHALLSALVSLKEELNVDISAEASLIDTGILAAYHDPVGKVMNIVSARRQAIQLRRSIDGVLTSLHRIEEDLMSSESLFNLLAQFMERFVEKLLLANYRTLKASAYNPMRFQRSIRENTELFMNDEGQISRAASALVDQGLAVDHVTARTQILDDLSRIRDVFLNLGEKLDIIDRFSYKLERRIATTVRYQETARNVKEESLRSAIRLIFSIFDAEDATCISPLVNPPVPYSTATLAVPRKTREPVKPKRRQPKKIDPIDLKREEIVDSYLESMAVTPNAIGARLRSFATKDQFIDLDTFEPKSARDIAILYEIRAGTLDEIPGIEIRRGTSSRSTNRFVSGPSILIRKTGE